MNREIKFRAWGNHQMWYKDTKTIDGNNTILKFFNGGIGWGLYDAKLENRLVTGDPNAVFNTPGVLMQFTGLRDSYGNEIYEGDIVSHCRPTVTGNVICFPVVFDFDGWKLGGDKYTPTRPNKSYWKQVKVIGNIYENPYLLNQGKDVKRSVATEES